MILIKLVFPDVYSSIKNSQIFIFKYKIYDIDKYSMINDSKPIPFKFKRSLRKRPSDTKHKYNRQWI